MHNKESEIASDEEDLRIFAKFENEYYRKKYALLARLNKTEYPDLLKEVFFQYPHLVWECNHNVISVELLFPSDYSRIELFNSHKKEFIAMSVEAHEGEDLMDMINNTVEKAMNMVGYSIHQVKLNYRDRNKRRKK